MAVSLRKTLLENGVAGIEGSHNNVRFQIVRSERVNSPNRQIQFVQTKKK